MTRMMIMITVRVTGGAAAAASLSLSESPGRRSAALRPAGGCQCPGLGPGRPRAAAPRAGPATEPLH